MTSQNGLSLTGVYATRFGRFLFSNIKGDGVFCPNKTYGPQNPDPYANTYVYFEGLAINSGGWLLRNLNGVGMTDGKAFTTIYVRLADGANPQ